MTKKLTAIGNSLGVIIEKPILDLLNIDRTTELEVRTDGEAIFLRPVHKSRLQRVQASAERMMSAHEQTLKKLAE